MKKTIIKNIPPYPHSSNDDAFLENITLIELGHIPSNGISWKYENMEMKPITALSRQYLVELYDSIKITIDALTGDSEYSKWLKYLHSVMTFCAGSPELYRKKN